MKVLVSNILVRLEKILDYTGVGLEGFTVCSPHYIAIQIKKSASVIKVATMKNMDDFSIHKGNHHVHPPN